MKKLDISLLLVEDDTVIRNIYQQILSKYVNILFVAGNGQEGYSSYLKNKPDLILTDIKMPVMNGLDMINKIREEDKTMRIIIMSAYSESRFFINAIESGVKGFLIKPVDTEHLKSVILEQANDILLEKRIIVEAELRRKAEMERDRGEEILKSLLMATAKFFDSGVNEASLNEALAITGEKANVSRAYIFKIHQHNNQSVISHINEWVNEGISPEIDNENLKNIPADDSSMGIFKENMEKHLNVSGNPNDFDEPARTHLLDQGIKTMIAIPIFVKSSWWGFIGFDDCVNERKWTDSEIYGLEMLAYMLGGVLYRGEVENEMTKLNAMLEERVYERTIELEQEVLERTNTEIRLKDSDEKYRQIYENANDGILLLIDNVVTLINPKVAEILQAFPKEIIGSLFSSFIKLEYDEQIRIYFDGKDVANKIELQVQLNNEIWIELKATAISWDMDPAYLIFISNISKRKNAENALNNLNRTLEGRIEEEIKRVNIQQQFLVQKSKLESIGELSAGLAHEINQPLGGISMGLENILFNISDDNLDFEYLKNKINILFNDIDRIQKIIEHVRLFSRDQENSVVENVLLSTVIKNALSLVSKQLIGKNIEVVKLLPDEPIEILGNMYRLEQVLLNIISNARYAVDEKEKGIVPDTFKRITIELVKNIPNAEIIVTDNGIGIEPSIQSKVFDPFFTTKSEDKGTGLGLSISYGIIAEMNGKITIDSESGKYTRMIIKLPLI